jgi:FkbM family methyltransferase
MLEFLRRTLPRDALPRVWWRRARYWYVTRKLAGPRLLRAFASAYPDAFFVQIGSNDGEQLDPLRRTILAGRWRGLMVEPVPYVYERLLHNYVPYRDRIRCVNAAIADHDGELPFFHLRPVEDYRREGLPFWYDQLGSFRKSVVLKHADVIPDIERRLVEVRVPCLSFDTLCQRHEVDRVDLLHTDTEGYDFELLKGIDLDRHRPRLLIYEHFHFTPEDRAACQVYLAGHGYEAIEEGMDTWCLRVRDAGARDAGLLALWRWLQRRTAR